MVSTSETNSQLIHIKFTGTLVRKWINDGSYFLFPSFPQVPLMNMHYFFKIITGRRQHGKEPYSSLSFGLSWVNVLGTHHLCVGRTLPETMDSSCVLEVPGATKLSGRRNALGVVFSLAYLMHSLLSYIYFTCYFRESSASLPQPASTAASSTEGESTTELET